MAKKKPLGFETPSMRIQDEYEEVLEQIIAKKADWEKAFVRLKKMYETSSDRLNDALKDTKSESEETEVKESLILADLIRITYQGLLSGQLLTKVMVAGVGKELAECDTRIAAIEKELKCLRKGL